IDAAEGFGLGLSVGGEAANIPPEMGAVGDGRLERMDGGMTAGMIGGLPSESVVRMKMDPEGEGAGAGPKLGGGVERGERGSGGATDGGGGAGTNGDGGGTGADGGRGNSIDGGMTEGGVAVGTAPGDNPVTTNVTGAGVLDPVGGGIEI